MISFSTIPYAEAVERARRQDSVIVLVLVAGLVVLATVLGQLLWS